MFRKFKQYGWIIVSCIAGIVILFLTSKSEPKKAIVINDQYSNEVESSDEINAVSVEQYTMVDVKGEVNQPGVFEIAPDARVNDVIALAGGFTEDADELHVNKAQKVHDEMVIYVPKINEIESVPDQVGATSKNQAVRLNYATKEEIVELPGIGPSKADAIISYREENGLFTSVDDILNVSGIGEKTLENLKEFIQVP